MEVTYINVIEDIIDIVRNDKRHNVKIEIDSAFLTVYLDDDPEMNDHEECVIPVRYDSLYECAIIPHKEYIDLMDGAPNDSGMDKEEIELILKIMDYMESNSKKIDEYMDALRLERRIESN